MKSSLPFLVSLLFLGGCGAAPGMIPAVGAQRAVKPLSAAQAEVTIAQLVAAPASHLGRHVAFEGSLEKIERKVGGGPAGWVGYRLWDRHGNSLLISNVRYTYQGGASPPHNFFSGKLFRDADPHVRRLLGFGVFTRVEGRFERAKDWRDGFDTGEPVPAVRIERIDGVSAERLIEQRIHPGSGA